MLFSLLEAGAQFATAQPASNAKYSNTTASYKTEKQLENLHPGFWAPTGFACVNYLYCHFPGVK